MFRIILLSLFAAALACAQSKPLDIYWIDTEGGAATLIVSPTGESLLVDAGYPDGDRDAKRIMAAVQTAGLKKIDYLITTHYHGDHIGGLEGVLKRIPIGTFIDHGANVEHVAPGEKVPPDLKGGTPDDLYPKYLEVIKGHPHIVAKPSQLPCPMMSAATGFHHDTGYRPVGKER